MIFCVPVSLANPSALLETNKVLETKDQISFEKLSVLHIITNQK